MNKKLLISHNKPAGRGIALMLALLLALFAAVPASAGGWAVISLDNLPGEVAAGEPVHLEFTVLQHGETPVHTVFEGQPVTPFLSATNVETGETVRVEAAKAKEPGRFTLDVTFPTAGTWEWAISPDPLIGETTFAPLNVGEPAVSVMARPVSQPAAAAIEPGLS